MTGVICAFDQATTTGAAWGQPGCPKPEWCSVTFKGDAPGEVLSKFTFFARELLYRLKPNIVIRESVYFPRPRLFEGKGPQVPMINAATMARLYAMAETIDSLCFELRIKKCLEARAAEVSLRFLGSGKALPRKEKKAAYIRRCKEFGWEPVGENEADACGIWFAAECEFAPRDAEHRRRLAADRDREMNGAGPLFRVF